MEQVTLDLSPLDIVGWLRDDRRREGGIVDYFAHAWCEYDLEEEFDYEPYGLTNGEDYDLVSVEAILDVEPHVERNYWILQVRKTILIGPRLRREEDRYFSGGIDLEQFETEFLRARRGTTDVILWTETPEARRHFDDWLAGMRADHAAEG